MLIIPRFINRYRLRLFEIAKPTCPHQHPTNDFSPLEQTYIQLKALPLSIEQLKAEAILAQTCELRQNIFINPLGELPTHRFINKLVNQNLGNNPFIHQEGQLLLIKLSIKLDLGFLE